MTELPTRDEINKLHRNAMIAFAARCARRAQPLYALGKGIEDHLTHIRSIQDALVVSELSFAGVRAVGAEAVRATIDQADSAARAAEAAGASIAAFAASSARDAASAACASPFTRSSDATAAVQAAASATDAISAIRADFKIATELVGLDDVVDDFRARLQAAFQEAKDTETLIQSVIDVGNQMEESGALAELTDEPDQPETSIAVGLFGPMWPEEEPEWYTEGLNKTRELLAE